MRCSGVAVVATRHCVGPHALYVAGACRWGAPQHGICQPPYTARNVCWRVAHTHTWLQLCGSVTVSGRATGSHWPHRPQTAPTRRVRACMHGHTRSHLQRATCARLQACTAYVVACQATCRSRRRCRGPLSGALMRSQFWRSNRGQHARACMLQPMHAGRGSVTESVAVPCGGHEQLTHTLHVYK